jgi:hypothetical protein
MAERGFAGVRLRRRMRITVPELPDVTAPDLLNRDFTAERPTREYAGDITTCPWSAGQTSTWRP